MKVRVPLADSGSLAVHLEEPGRSDGRATVALYLHGFGSSQEGEKADLLRQRFLATDVAFCSFDFQGHGDSDGSMLDLSISRNLSDTAIVHRWLLERDYEQIILFGSSMGGLTGLWHAVRSTHPVIAAIHLAPALGLEETMLTELGADSVAAWERDGKLEIGHDLGAWDIGWSFVEDLRSLEIERLCADYATPTLIFQGKHDTSVPWRAVVDFATQAAGEAIELHLFADGDHRMIERLPRLWQLTEEFLLGRGLLTG